MSSYPVPGPPRPGAPRSADLAPSAGDDGTDGSALAELDAVDPGDLDAVLASAESVLATLQDRLRAIGD